MCHRQSCHPAPFVLPQRRRPYCHSNSWQSAFPYAFQDAIHGTQYLRIIRWCGASAARQFLSYHQAGRFPFADRGEFLILTNRRFLRYQQFSPAGFSPPADRFPTARAYHAHHYPTRPDAPDGGPAGHYHLLIVHKTGPGKQKLPSPKPKAALSGFSSSLISLTAHAIHQNCIPDSKRLSP